MQYGGEPEDDFGGGRAPPLKDGIEVLLQVPDDGTQFIWKNDFHIGDQQCTICVTGFVKQVLVVVTGGYPGAMCEAEPYSLESDRPAILRSDTDVMYRTLVGTPDTDLHHLLMHRMMPSVLHTNRSLLLFCGIRTAADGTLSSDIDTGVYAVARAVEAALRSFPASGRVFPTPTPQPPLPATEAPVRRFVEQPGGDDGDE